MLGARPQFQAEAVTHFRQFADDLGVAIEARVGAPYAILAGGSVSKVKMSKFSGKWSLIWA